MIDTVLIIFPLLIPVLVLGHFFVRLFSGQPDKYTRIYCAFAHASPSFVPGGHWRFAQPAVQVERE